MTRVEGDRKEKPPEEEEWDEEETGVQTEEQ